MLYQILKSIHVIGATMFFGAGMASAFYKFRADQSGKIEDIVFAQKNIVLADWLFTVPSGVIMPVTGIWMALLFNYSLTSGWVFWGILLYVIAGLCWLPAAWLQIRMRDVAITALNEQSALPPEYHRWARIWLILGFPAFLASVWAIYIMVTKQAPF